MTYRWLLTILFGLFIIWTGLLRSIEAQEFKPNSFWFCVVAGSLAIAAGFLFRLNRNWLGWIFAMLAVAPVLSFYVYCFISQPEKDATYRVGLAIIAAIAELCVIMLPRSRECSVKHSS
jgi:hypothetical protein